METQTKLNLARKWRSRNFDEVVGQALPVRMLKNSLYLGHYFPVYLFSGQRGCGKTTTARIFAAAIGCSRLDAFQKDPRNVPLPCLVCDSCIALREGRHPDFIEMDAASHTGVDNVRNIIEAASLLPSMSRKRVYLIDEAHMLSKAAFNALLKILEEPPRTALFILATTDPQKIIETVRSRCFQLFFRPITGNALVEHLTNVCKQEQITFEDDGLALLAREADGSARDALNLLEQVRFSSSGVTKGSVLSVLCHLDDEQLIELARAALTGEVANLCALFERISLDMHDPAFIWKRLSSCVRAAVWWAYGVEPEADAGDTAACKKLAQDVPIDRLHALVKLLCERELAFSKTRDQHAFLRMVLLSFAYDQGPLTGGGNAPPAAQAAPMPDDKQRTNNNEQDEEEGDEQEQEEEEQEEDASWDSFMKHAVKLSDPLLLSIMSQARSVSFDDKTGVVHVTFPRDFALFSDTLERGTSEWLPLLRKVFGVDAKLDASFNGAVTPSDMPQKAHQVRAEQPKSSETASKQSVVRAESAYEGKGARRTLQKRSQTPRAVTGKRIDVSDVGIWKTANLVLEYFPGVVTEHGDSLHG